MAQDWASAAPGGHQGCLSDSHLRFHSSSGHGERLGVNQ